MIIEIEIPDWANEHELFLFHGTELIGVMRQGHPWAVKEDRCSRCGSCCEERHIKLMPLPVKREQCLYLRRLQDGKTKCSWEEARPFCCCIGEPKFEPNCNVSWRHMSNHQKIEQNEVSVG